MPRAPCCARNLATGEGQKPILPRLSAWAVVLFIFTIRLTASARPTPHLETLTKLKNGLKTRRTTDSRTTPSLRKTSIWLPCEPFLAFKHFSRNYGRNGNTFLENRTDSL